jgi:aspartate/methionine/tyrosine aminotransferase
MWHQLVMANAKHIDGNSYRLAFDIFNKAHAAVTSGIDFGSEGKGYLRFSYAVKPARIKEGLKSLEKYLKER